MDHSRYKVFISHAGEESWSARKISEDIRHRGGEFFHDQFSIESGATIETDILKHLRTSDELWVLLTAAALVRPYVWMEVGAAWAKRIRIVSIVWALSKEEIAQSKDIPMLVKNGKLVHANDEHDYNRLLDELKRRIKQRQTSPRKRRTRQRRGTATR